MALSPVSIGRSLEHLGRNSWLLPNPTRDFRDMKLDLVNCIEFDSGWERVSSDVDLILELKEWVSVTPDWKDIILRNDVAMFPVCLAGLKSVFMCNVDKVFCENVSRLSFAAVNDVEGVVFHRLLMDYRAEYGVFRFRCVVGDVLFKALRRHLRVSLEEFTGVYGLGLFYDDCFCDDLLVELLVVGRLRGPVRGYKLDGEFYPSFL